ncbi:hypothetical protein TR75_03025 [Hydrogenibacillus schlegelii]|nr:hypothetical protein TR75_03025 [Hydrogenibacillus schlegelii]
MHRRLSLNHCFANFINDDIRHHYIISVNERLLELTEIPRLTRPVKLGNLLRNGPRHCAERIIHPRQAVKNSRKCRIALFLIPELDLLSDGIARRDESG